MKKIIYLDPSVTTDNVGDTIIAKSAIKQIEKFFKGAFFLNVSTHNQIDEKSIDYINDSDYSFVLGSNLLYSNMRKQRQWRIYWKNLFKMKKNKITLVGAGWNNYEKEPNLYTKWFFNFILSKETIHSVRDNYTKQMLNKIGITNVLNTSCATMWDLTKEFCKEIPKEKSSKVVFTITDYRKNIEKDREFIKILLDNYDKVYFFPQGIDDPDYWEELFMPEFSKIEIISSNIEGFDEVLAAGNVDYIGTRLHGGIRALQHKNRTIILGVDNRALEKSKDFNLPVVDRENLNELKAKINEDFETAIKIPLKEIREWKSQFLKK